VPGTVEAPTLIVRVEVADPPDVRVTEVGLNVAVVPVGAPETVRPTVPVKPFKEVTVIVEVPDEP